MQKIDSVARKNMLYSIRVSSCRWRPQAKNAAEFLRKPKYHRTRGVAVWQANGDSGDSDDSDDRDDRL